MKKSTFTLFHLLFWIFSSLLATLVFQLQLIGHEPYIYENIGFLLITLPIGACIFYASYFSLNFFEKRPVRFLWIILPYTIFLLFLIFNKEYGISTETSDGLKRYGFLSVLFVLIPVLYFNVSGFLIKAFIEWVKERKINAELEKEKIESQLELLKSKMNPHFLFNTLNNIDVLIHEDPRKASDYLNKLSEMLRFILYEIKTEYISLADEINYIKKYIDLQKIRTVNDEFVEFQIIGDIDYKYIAPMIFIHFIENAFKHAANKKIKNAISIKFEISDNAVLFICKNYMNSKAVSPDEKNGLGIQLIKQRLNLLYKEKYELNISDKDNWYTIKLKMILGND